MMMVPVYIGGRFICNRPKPEPSDAATCPWTRDELREAAAWHWLCDMGFAAIIRAKKWTGEKGSWELLDFYLCIDQWWDDALDYLEHRRD